MENVKRYRGEFIFTEEQEQKIIDMYLNQNLSTVKIGKHFGCGNKVIARILDKYNIPRTGAGRRKYALNEKYFDEIDTQNKAYILGFFYADGCNFTSKQTISMSLQEEDKDILESIRNEIESEKELEFLDYSNKHDFGYTYKNQYRLLFFSSHMSRVLEKLGMINNKSLQLTFPEWLNEELIPHFIRGVFDGDGCVCLDSGIKNNNVITVTATENFCNSLKLIIEKNLNISTYIKDSSCHNGVTKVLYIYGANQVKIFLDWIYKDSILYLERKYKKYIDKYYNSSQVA